MKNLTTAKWLFAFLAIGLLFGACKKKALDVTSGFTYKIDATDFRKVAFTSISVNAVSLAWDFGDGATSTETNPTHDYAGAGDFTVKLTATGSDGTDLINQTVKIVDPNAELTKLVGQTSKSWKLLRAGAPGTWGLEVGPTPRTSASWWATGNGNDEIALRPCLFNDEWVFSRDGKMQYKTNGDYWAEGGVFDPGNDCRSSAAGNMTGPGGADFSAFGDGTHSFGMTAGAAPKLTVTGLGAFIGLQKIGTGKEVNTPQQSVEFEIVKLSDGATDTLILNELIGNGTAYWRIVLVSYDNPANEPPIPSPKPQPIFTAAQNKLKLVTTNNSKFANSYVWEFGDGATSTETSPTHDYATAGEYKVKLTATNAVGSVSQEQTFTMTTGVITEANIVGAAWKVRKAANSVFVGPALGSADWWQVPLAGLDGTATMPTDDWSCMTDDEFIFTSGGKYEYKTNGTARNDSYMGQPTGCWSDAQIAGSGNGAAFGSGVHSFTFAEAAGPSRPIITLTNGATGAAFVGFYKGYYGGENGDSPGPAQPLPNGGNATNRYEVISYVKAGGVETVVLSVDISAAHDGSKAWSVVLVR